MAGTGKTHRAEYERTSGCVYVMGVNILNKIS